MKPAIVFAAIMWSLVAVKAMNDKVANATDAPNSTIVQADTTAICDTSGTTTTARVDLATLPSKFRTRLGR